MLDSNCLYVQDENGEDKKMVILFTFDSPDLNKQYVVFQDPQGEEDEIFAAEYNEQGELSFIDSEEELEMVQEVVNTFLQDEEETDD